MGQVGQNRLSVSQELERNPSFAAAEWSILRHQMHPCAGRYFLLSLVLAAAESSVTDRGRPRLDLLEILLVFASWNLTPSDTFSCLAIKDWILSFEEGTPSLQCPTPVGIFIALKASLHNINSALVFMLAATAPGDGPAGDRVCGQRKEGFTQIPLKHAGWSKKPVWSNYPKRGGHRRALASVLASSAMDSFVGKQKPRKLQVQLACTH